MAVDKLVWKIILDIFILLCVIAPWVWLMVGIEPYHRGYFPDDSSLSLPYKQQQISELTLGFVGFAIIIVTVVITEVIHDHKNKGIGEKFLNHLLIPGWLWESYHSIGIFTFGAVCQQLTSEFTKKLIGRLRPNFFAVCQPVPVALSPLNTLGYIQDFNCAGTDEAMNKDVRLSFYSAHSSFAFYTALFLILYAQARVTWSGSALLRPSLQLATLLAAWYTSLTRVTDNMHHAGDVFAGIVTGALYGIVAFIFVHRIRPHKYRSSLPSPWPPMTQTDMPR